MGRNVGTLASPFCDCSPSVIGLLSAGDPAFEVGAENESPLPQSRSSAAQTPPFTIGLDETQPSMSHIAKRRRRELETGDRQRTFLTGTTGSPGSTSSNVAIGNSGHTNLPQCSDPARIFCTTGALQPLVVILEQIVAVHGPMTSGHSRGRCGTIGELSHGPEFKVADFASSEIVLSQDSRSR
ncbi:hypothetical protein RRSWK_06711 [Rhodopirellula sp. SWK7]|nr:hypothetical protein RRSWK_06711 [Rhodopirellula sp. SWK7]